MSEPLIPRGIVWVNEHEWHKLGHGIVVERWRA